MNNPVVRGPLLQYLSLYNFLQPNRNVAVNILQMVHDGDIEPELAADIVKVGVVNSNAAKVILKYLDDENYSDDSITYTQETIDEILSINLDDYPGKDDNLPFEWWLDDEFIENLYGQDYSDTWDILTTAEKDLIKSFPRKAYTIMKNKDIAQQKTINIFGNTPQMLNGKPDAFRHAIFKQLIL